MSLREELERVVSMGRRPIGDGNGNVNEYKTAIANLIRDHGQALLDALEDGDRLDWLFKQWTGEALRKIGVVYSEPSEYRQAIDAAIKGDG